MSVQARHLSHAFPQDPRAFWAMENAMVGGSMFLDEHGGGRVPAEVAVGDSVLLNDFPRSELTCNYGFEPRKRARVVGSAAGFLENQCVGMPAPTELASVCDVQGSAISPGVASTSGRVGIGGSIISGGQPPHLHHHGVEIDALIRLESERMRAGLEEARRRHALALLAAVEHATSGRLCAAEAEVERALRRNADLEERARQMGEECQAWMGVARSHEAVAAGLRATIDQLLQSPCAAGVAIGQDDEGEAEDAQSCCFEAPAADAIDNAASFSSRASAASSCRACGGGEASVLLLPCRHLCLCRACEDAVDTCPVCAAAKNASLHVLLS